MCWYEDGDHMFSIDFAANVRQILGSRWSRKKIYDERCSW